MPVPPIENSENTFDNSTQPLQHTIDTIDHEVDNLINHSAANFKSIINKYIYLLQVQEAKIKQKDTEIRSLKQTNIKSLAQIGYLNSLCDQFEETIYNHSYA